MMDLGLPSPTQPATRKPGPGRLILKAAWYTRSYLQAHPDRLFAWGDNLARYGGAKNPKSGQAFACRGEPNAVGIPTKRLPTMNSDAFFSDRDNVEGSPVRREIDQAFDRLETHLRNGGDVVWPADGIGTGRAKLEQMAPAVWEHIQVRLRMLKQIASSVERER